MLKHWKISELQSMLLRTIIATILSIETVQPGRFTGQVIRDGDRIVYASLPATQKWLSDNKWQTAQPFAITSAILDVSPERVFDRRASDRDQNLPLNLFELSHGSVHGKGTVADDSPSVASGVSRVTEVQLLDLQSPTLRGAQKTVGRRGAAGFIRRERWP